MPHCILEYSANLDESIDIPVLLKTLSAAAVETELFPLAGIRCRAHRCEHFLIADGNPNFGFLHLQIKIGAGRSDEAKKQAADSIFEALNAFLQPLSDRQGLAISFEMSEFPAILKYNKNNLRDYLP